MKRFGFFFVALFVLFTSRNTFSQEKADAPAYRNGDRWIFRAIEKDARSKSSNELNIAFRLQHREGSGVTKVWGRVENRLTHGTVNIHGIYDLAGSSTTVTGGTASGNSADGFPQERAVPDL